MKMETEKEMSDLRMMYLEMESSTFFRSELFDAGGCNRMKARNTTTSARSALRVTEVVRKAPAAIEKTRDGSTCSSLNSTLKTTLSHTSSCCHSSSALARYLGICAWKDVIVTTMAARMPTITPSARMSARITPTHRGSSVSTLPISCRESFTNRSEGGTSPLSSGSFSSSPRSSSRLFASCLFRK